MGKAFRISTSEKKRTKRPKDWEAHLSCRALGQIARPLYTCLSQSLDVDMALAGGGGGAGSSLQLRQTWKG